VCVCLCFSAFQRITLLVDGAEGAQGPICSTRELPREDRNARPS
jgi:hypothetical protein